jgi:hypothetical protein
VKMKPFAPGWYQFFPEDMPGDGPADRRAASWVHVPATAPLAVLSVDGARILR